MSLKPHKAMHYLLTLLFQMAIVYLVYFIGLLATGGKPTELQMWGLFAGSTVLVTFTELKGQQNR